MRERCFCSFLLFSFCPFLHFLLKPALNPGLNPLQEAPLLKTELNPEWENKPGGITREV